MKHIFLHGLGQTSLTWKKTIDYMEEKTDILCPNLSDFLENKEVTCTNLYQAFSEYCGNFSEPFNLCGLSLGGILALQYAIENPAKVNAMVLIGTQYVMPKKLLKIQNAVFYIMPNGAFKQMGFGKKEFIHLSKSMMSLDFHQDLKKFSCPVLVICGEKDKANRRASMELKEKIPNAKIQIIEKAGHEVNIEQPEILGDILNHFFNRKL